MILLSPQNLHGLLLLNIALQLFDGVATAQGVHIWGEGNPLLRDAMHVHGVEQALLLYKAKACGCLVLLRRVPAPGVAQAGLLFVAAAYVALSLIPWLLNFSTLLSS